VKRVHCKQVEVNLNVESLSMQFIKFHGKHISNSYRVYIIIIKLTVHVTSGITLSDTNA